MNRYGEIPQFHKNPRFVRTLKYTLLFFVLILAGIWIYSQKVHSDQIKAKSELIEAALELYHREFQEYPISLDVLVQEKFLNQIPQKGDSEDFVYQPQFEKNKMSGYTLH